MSWGVPIPARGCCVQHCWAATNSDPLGQGMGSRSVTPMRIPAQSLQPHLALELSFSSELLILLRCPPSMLSELKRLMKVGRSANDTGMEKAEEIHRKPFGSLTRGSQACSQNI